MKTKGTKVFIISFNIIASILVFGNEKLLFQIDDIWIHFVPNAYNMEHIITVLVHKRKIKFSYLSSSKQKNLQRLLERKRH